MKQAVTPLAASAQGGLKDEAQRPRSSASAQARFDQIDVRFEVVDIDMVLGA
jgi:hypothetical protein